MSAALRPCGTPAAYRRHLRNGEAVDEACAAAWRAQKNVRDESARADSAAAVVSAIAAEPVVESVDELAEALENLRIVRAAMSDAPANSIAGLSKRREELVSRIARLQAASNPEVSALDQLAQRRSERLAASAN